MLEWIIIGGIVVVMYLVIYKYEKKMDAMQKLIDENKNNISSNKDKISSNHERLDDHYNHLEKIWHASPPKHKH